MRRKTREEMYPIVSEYHQGESTVSELCQRYLLTKSQFYYWHRKYTSEHNNQPSDFIPICISNRDEYNLEVVTPSGLTIRSRELLSAAYLKTLMSVR